MTLAEKHRVKWYSDFVGQEKAIKEVKEFIKNFPKKRALILYGPAGTGKTSLAIATAKENNFEILELNSSDLRNRAKIESIVKPAVEQQSLFKKGKIILMDEVDGVTGTDIGGIPELVRTINITKYPMILTCNDVWQTKLAPLRSISKIVEMKPLDIGQIVSVLSRICEKEKINKDFSFLRQIAIRSQGDMRAAINDLQSYAHIDENLIETTEKRDLEESIFNILRRLFKERHDFLDIFDTTELSLDEIMLWLEENIPREYKNEALIKAYYSLSKADIFRGRIYKNQSWRFLVYQNIFQSAGIAYAKKLPSGGFTKYERPKRVLKIWMYNQKMNNKKTIAKKYAKYVHCSSKRAMRDFDLIRPILKDKTVQRALRMSEEEIEFLNK